MKLAIVGSRTLHGNVEALRIIEAALDDYMARYPGDLKVISGGARGVDKMVAHEARRRRLPMLEYLAGGGGPSIWARNRRIATECDELICIVDRESPTHGAEWTADRAREMGKPVTPHMIDTGSTA